MDKMAMIGRVIEGIKIIIGGFIGVAFIWLLMWTMWIIWG